MARLERANAGVKVLCLTTWRHPKVEKCRGPGRARSPVLWGGIWGSNPRHPEPQSGALPTELIPPYSSSLQALARQEGLEPPAYCLEGSCSIRLSYWRIVRVAGAGEGNRTLVPSLEGWYSTIELHPQAWKAYHSLGRMSRAKGKFFGIRPMSFAARASLRSGRACGSRTGARRSG